MRVEDPELLKEFRGPGFCEVCRKWCKHREVLHLFSRGAGRLDVRINLVSVGSTRRWQCDCHSANHQKTNGRIVTRRELLEIVAKRESTTPEAIVAEIHRLRRLPQPIGSRLGTKRPRRRTPAHERMLARAREYRREQYRRSADFKKKLNQSRKLASYNGGRTDDS